MEFRKGEEEDELLNLFRQHILHGLNSGIKEKSKQGAIIQYLLYEGWVRQALRAYAPSGISLSKGIVTRRKYYECSPEFDIITFEGSPIVESGEVAVVPHSQVRAVVEVERVLDSSVIRRKLEGWKGLKAWTPKLAVLCYGLWQPSLDDNGESSRVYAEKMMDGIHVFYLSFGYGESYFLHPVKGEVSRLARYIL